MDSLRLLGRGPGFFLFAALSLAAMTVLAWLGKDVAALTGPLGVVCAGLYGGGGFKAWSEAKNGKVP
jgi:hypothetical protein